MVTVEIAMGLMVLVPVAVTLMALLLVGAEQVRLVESARTAARMLSRGQEVREAEALVERTIPASRVEVERRGEDVVVTVARRIDPIGLLPAFTLHASAVTAAEEVS